MSAIDPAIIDGVRLAVGVATFVQSVPVHEKHAAETVWHGTVQVFDLAGHQK